MNLSDRQKELVRLLFEIHKSTNGVEFNLVRSVAGFGLCWPRGRGYPELPYDDSDFSELRAKRLISFTTVARNVWRGRLNDLGIEIAQAHGEPISVSPQATGAEVSGALNSSSPKTATKKKRGRPQKIPDERKAAASRLKLGGGSNLAAAKVIYDKQYPTTQEVKNVPAILRNFQKKSDSRSVHPSSKANKHGG
jgi:hypothetical protein